MRDFQGTSADTAVRLRALSVTDDELIAETNGGRRISAPLSHYPRLLHGTPEERHNWRLIGDGDGIHWPDLDEDISAQNLLMAQPSGESQRSLHRWMDRRAKRASQENFEEDLSQLPAVEPEKQDGL